ERRGALGDVLVVAAGAVVDEGAAADAAHDQLALLQLLQRFAHGGARSAKMACQLTLRGQALAVAVGALEDRATQLSGDGGRAAARTGKRDLLHLRHALLAHATTPPRNQSRPIPYHLKNWFAIGWKCGVMPPSRSSGRSAYYRHRATGCSSEETLQLRR